LNGKRIAYTSEGTGITVVAVHGYPGSSRDFDALAQRLRESFRVLRIDMPGFGTSESLDEFPSYDNHARTLIAVLEALHIERPVLLTHSMGGAVAACALHEVPTLVSAAVLLAPPGLEPHRQYRRVPCKALSRALAPELARRCFAPVMRAVATRLGFPSSLPVEALYRATDMAAGFEMDEHARRMRAMRVPVMLAYAQDDPMVEPEIFRALAAVLPQGPRLEFRDGGHYVQDAHAAEISSTMASWLPAVVAAEGTYKTRRAGNALGDSRLEHK
jgi:pimeloyl-ACP methyl ester carboxylesterase